MNRIIIIFVIFSLQLSCNNHVRITDLKGNLIKRDYGKGEYIKYYSNGIIKSIQLNRNKFSNDTLFYFLKLDTINDLRKAFNNKYFSVNYDKKGFLRSKGFVDSTYVKVGIWNYYLDAKPNIDIEYLNIDGKEFTNRIWDKNDDDKSQNNLYYLKTKKDTFSVGEIVRLKVYLIYPYYYESEASVLLPKMKEGNVLQDNYYNARELEYDTIGNVSFLLKKLGKKETEKYNNLRVVVDYIFSKTGEKKIKGILLEKFENNDSIFINELFFTKKVFIKKKQATQDK